MTTTQTVIDVAEVPTEETEEVVTVPRFQRIRTFAENNKGKLIAAACVATGFVAGAALAARVNDDTEDSEENFSDEDDILADTDPE